MVLEGAVRGTGELGHFLAGMPGLLTRAARIAEQIDQATRQGITLAPETLAAIGAAERRRRRWSTLALWAIVALLVVLILKIK